MNHIVFISHSSRDDQIALRIYDRLTSHGIRCWLDRKNLDSNALEGVDYARAIVRAIDHATIFISILTSSAEQSENVKNETELAHRKIAQGMVILPFQLTQEKLAEEFRYYFCRTNMFDGTLPPLEERIRSFCNVVERAVEDLADAETSSPAADQARLKLLDRDATLEEQAAVDALLEGITPARLGHLLAHLSEELDRHYREVVDPYEHYAFYNSYETQGCRFKVLTETLYRRGRFSIALGDIFQNLSYALINSGNIAYVQDARRFLGCALNIYEHMMDTSPDNAERIAEAIIKSQWLLSITHKIERNYGISNQILQGLLVYAEQQRDELGLPYSKSVLLPRRELAIVNNDYDDLVKLATDDINLIEDPIERFYTYRRAFEISCAEEDERTAAQLKDPMIASFNECREQLYGVYYYAMMYNVFQFYSRFGHLAEAERLYQELLPELEEKHFDRYASKLEAAHERMVQGRRADDYVK